MFGVTSLKYITDKCIPRRGERGSRSHKVSAIPRNASLGQAGHCSRSKFYDLQRLLLQIGKHHVGRRVRSCCSLFIFWGGIMGGRNGKRLAMRPAIVQFFRISERRALERDLCFFVEIVN